MNIFKINSFLLGKNFVQYIKNISYTQGQYQEGKIREYFYYIDHQGMLFLDDARMKNFTSCFKEKKFLKFFFNHLKMNTTNRYQEFPYISLCGRERNYVRCDDRPIVYNQIISKSETEILLSYNHAGDLLTTKFFPDKVIMLPDTCRVYHPASDKVGGVGLIASKLAIELSKSFTFKNGENNPPTHLTFNNVTYELDTMWYQNIKLV